MGFLADDEEAAFREFAANPDDGTQFEDPVFARIVDVYRERRRGLPRGLDLAVLLRQVLRRASIRDGAPFRLALADRNAPSAHELSRVGVRCVPGIGGSVVLEAEPWQPEWLDAAEVDRASAAGTSAGTRISYESFPTDPFFREATGFSSYRTAGQRAAVRAAVSMPEGGTLIAVLPTGSGKTEVATAVAHLSRRQTTIIVVPTVALAYDFERRFRDDFLKRRPELDPKELLFAWTAETPPEQRERFRHFLVGGKVPLLVTSPESLTGALLNSVRSAADAGRLRALVIDEAHLVSQWGRDFRPEFRQLASLRRELLRRSQAGGGGFRTLLLSATLGDHEFDDLVAQFAEPGPISVVAANALRPEPEYWVGGVVARQDREHRVLEAVAHLPRPLILYVTQPSEAQRWERRIRGQGFERVEVVTGKTAGVDRRAVLEGLRSGPNSTSLCDVVVATSAFGLGIDNDQVRSVVHACLPESLDRWYQEVGRGGRDGHCSMALLLPAFGDDEEAASLGITMLKPETAARRWHALWDGRKKIGEATYIDLHSSAGDAEQGSYNRRWNAQLLRGLEDMGQIRRDQLSLTEAVDLDLPAGAVDRPREWERVELLLLDHQRDNFFESVWEPWRQSLMAQDRKSLDQLKAACRGGASVCDLLERAYRPGENAKAQFPVAAKGMAPVARCGRCPGCRSGKVREHIAVPPRGEFFWMTDCECTPALERLLKAAPTRQGLAVLVADEPADLAEQLAKGLFKAGVRTFAGVDIGLNKDWYFVDDPDVHPWDLPPVPAFVVLPNGAAISVSWDAPSLRPRLADGTPVPVVMLASRTTTIGLRSRPVTEERVLDAYLAFNHLKGAS